jgi:hypothetical protein
MSWGRGLAITAVVCASSVHADDPIDRVSEALTFSSFDDHVRTRISGMADAEFYHFDREAAGLIDSSSENLFNPRLALFLDVQLGAHLYFFAQARVDRGFDPSNHGIEARLDEYALRVSPWDDGRLSIQAGQFATIVGNWVQRHLSWDNPFITAPVPYEHLTAILDTEAPGGVAEFLTINRNESYEYNPVIWGPVYATGASVAGRIEKFEYAVEMKNAGPSSRPESWNVEDVGFAHPNFAARLGYRPDLRWNFGVSASVGPYLRPEAGKSLPSGTNIGDYRQFLFGQDFRFEWHRFQVWAEVYESRFEVPRVGEADTVAYYIETKYQFTPRMFAALRWNQQYFWNVSDENGTEARWGEDISRVDAALGFRFTAYTQFKFQYSLQHGRDEDQWSDLIAAQLTLKF